ncbi:MAG: exo-alpha-sialidase [Sphingopyxis sp.]|uniref:WD40/YVTN/BNR-like repeat-containing protein n=1 Tax=Sphingopyxis sp. TaxID=1908224 RepID=UPI001A3D391B|nr:sialidase family protein [Sphingopyxis sp.]MBL9070234.1 exo-alpha-sialidase [Sphingopyxis sp.]
MRNGGTILGGSKYERVRLGGGGYVTGLRIAGTGNQKVLVCRTDTCGGYIRGPNDTEWRLLLQAEINISESLMKYSYDRGAGCYDVCVAPSNTNYVYICQVGYVYRSPDRGASWVRTTLPVYNNYGANSGSRTCNERMNVDPANHLVVGFGPPDVSAAGGFKYTLDGGDTWVSHPDIPAPLQVVNDKDRGMAVTFDPESGTTSGRTNHVYVWSYGNGIYRSTTGVSGTFTLISGSPTDIGHMLARNGALWTGGTSQSNQAQLRKWTPGGGWADVAGVTDTKHLAISPDGTKFISMIGSSAYRASSNSGASFSGLCPSVGRQAVNIPWHQTTNENYMSNGAVVWDTDSNAIFLAEGIGCWKCNNPPLDGAIPTFLEDSVGIENLVSMQILVPPLNGRIHYLSQDRNVLTRERSQWNQYPANAGVTNVEALDHGGGIDHAAGDENWLAVVSSKNGRGNYSSNGGASWTPFTNVPANVLPTGGQPATGGQGFGGNVAVGAPGNVVWLPTGNNIPSFTKDGGATWAYCKFGGEVPPSTGMRWHNQYSYQRLQLIADKQNAGTFYLYHVGNQAHDAASQQFRGFWKSTDGGENWTRIRSGLITSSGAGIGIDYTIDAYNCKLRMPPGKSPHLFYCPGDVDADDTHANFGISFSADQGATWVDWTGDMNEPLDFAFGKAAPGAGYPAIYAWGGLSGVRGLHRCIDFNPSNPTAATWQTIGRYPGGDLDNGTVLGADMQVFGLCYIGFGGSGAFRARYDYTLRMS